MHSRRRSKLGLSLLEVLVAATLLAVGIVATFECLGAISRAQQLSLDTEEMQRLALSKYDDLVVAQSLTVGSSDGDFTDIGKPQFIWHAERDSTDVTNLDVLKVEVSHAGDDYRHAQKIQGLISRPPTKGSS